MRTITRLGALLCALCLPLLAHAKTLIIVTAADLDLSKDALIGWAAESTKTLKPFDRLIVYDARILTQTATVAYPTNAKAAPTTAWVTQKLAEQFAPLRKAIEALPTFPPPGEIAANLRIPDVLAEIGRNVIPALPEKKADVLLLGSWLFFDKRDARYSMADRAFPSDGHLKGTPSETPFGVMGRETLLEGSTLHFIWPGGQLATHEHEEAIRRWWTLWTVAQGGRVGTFSFDPAVGFRRMLASETSGQASYQPMPGAKREMLRAHAPIPAVPPASQEQPGVYFLHDNVTISTTPPSTTKGVAWIGLKWSAPCDVDLYSRPDSSKPWLFFGNVQTPDGRFNKDHRSSTGDRQYEYIEYSSAIDVTKSEIFINLYEGQLAAPPEGVVRVWMDGKVYEAPFKIAATRGNGGALPMSGPNWVKVDLRKILGLSGS